MFQRRCSLHIVPFAILATFAGVAWAQTEPVDARRVRGVIDKDQYWSGTILITDDVTIDGATVTVAAGTVIEFAVRRKGQNPRLIVGTPNSTGGRLVVQSTRRQPVTFRSRPGSNPGALLIRVRTALGDSPAAPDVIEWRYVRFENLGHVEQRRAAERAFPVATPGVLFHVSGPGPGVSLKDCRFTKTTRLGIRAADGARVELRDCRFTEPLDRLSVEVTPEIGRPAPRPVVISGNRMAAGISANGVAVDLRDNILIGPDAAVAIRNHRSAETRIVGNFIHNTTPKDDGHYCLDCENPDALIEDNILRGATSCVLNGSRRMSGNVLIAAPNLDNPLSPAAKTHQLVAALPPGAVFEKNLLLGPAYTLLIPQPRLTAPRTAPKASAGSEIIIRHNLFDGFRSTGRAIQLGRPDRGVAAVRAANNVFLRCRAIVVNDGRSGGTARHLFFDNAAAPPPRAAPAGNAAVIDEGLVITAPNVDGLKLSAPPADRVEDFDGDLRTGRRTVADIRQRLFDAYRPRGGSPLVGKEGAAKRPPFGPFEP